MRPPADPVALLAGLCVLAGVVALAAPGRAVQPPGPWTAGGKASAGCLLPSHATASDWRTVPGVTRRIANELEALCSGSALCAAGQPWPAIRGLGPAMAERLEAARCRSDSTAASGEPAHQGGCGHQHPAVRAAW